MGNFSNVLPEKIKLICCFFVITSTQVMYLPYKDNRYQANPLQPLRTTGNLYQGSEISTLSRSFDRSYTKFSLTSEGEGMDSSNSNQTLNENDVFARQSFLVLFDHANEANLIDAERARSLLRKVSHDMLATEWLNTEQHSIENRAYLIDNILPQVILGIEEVLREATDRRLVGSEVKPEAVKSEGFDPNFNPINRLAEYLMRNNIRYNNFSETSPYVRGLRRVAAKMKHEMFMRSENQSAKLKAMVTNIQEEKLHHEESARLELERKQRCLTVLFETFLPASGETIQSNVVQTAIRAFSKLLSKLPNPIKGCVVPIFDIQTVEDPPKSYDKIQFMTYMLMFAKPMPTELFDQFMEHMTLCATEYRLAMDKVAKSSLLANFYVSCDLEQVDVLSRKQMMNLCENYFEAADLDQREMLQDPREWPVREFHMRRCETREMGSREESQMNDFLNDDNNSAMVDTSSSSHVQPISLQNDEMFCRQTDHEAENSTTPVSEESFVRPETMKMDEDDDLTNSVDIDNITKNDGSDGEDRKEVSISEEQFTRVSSELSEGDILKALQMRYTLHSGSSSRDSRLSILHGYSPDRLSLPQFLHTADCLFRETSPLGMVRKFEQFLHCHRNEILIPEEQMTAHRKMSKRLLFEDNVNGVIERTFSALTRGTETPLYLSLPSLDKWIRLYDKRNVSEAWENAKMDLFKNVSHTMSVHADACDTQSVTEDVQSSRDSVSLPDGMWYGDSSSTVRCAQAMLINRSDFNNLLRKTTEKLHLKSNNDLHARIDELKNLADHLTVCSTTQMNSVELKEQIREACRQKWLDEITSACQITLHSMEPVFRAAFKALAKDARKHGDGKQIIAQVSLLRNDESDKKQFEFVHSTRRTSSKLQFLECVAAAPKTTAEVLVGKRIQPGAIASITFEALRSGKTVIKLNLRAANSTTSHLQAHCQNEAEKNTQNSSFTAERQHSGLNSKKSEPPLSVAIPISTDSGELIGVLGVDVSSNDACNAEFPQDELRFYRTVAEHLGQAYTTITYHRRLAYLVVTAFNWLAAHLDGAVYDMIFYSCRNEVTAEFDEATDGRHRRVSLREMVQRLNNQPAVLLPDIPTVRTRERTDYLCSIDSSEPSERHLFGQHYLVLPLRGPDTTAVGVVELSSPNKDFLHGAENLDQVMKMMNIMTMALCQLNLQESDHEDKDKKRANDEKNSNGNQDSAGSTEQTTRSSFGQGDPVKQLPEFQAIDAFQLLGKAEFASITNMLMKRIADIRQLYDNPSALAKQLLDMIKTTVQGENTHAGHQREMTIDEELMQMSQFEPTSTTATKTIEQQWLQISGYPEIVLV